MYYYAAKHHFADLEGYNVLYPKFLVCDSTNYSAPLFYNMSMDSFDAAEKGFTYKGREYPGVKSIIEDLKWAIKNDKWNISRENYLNNGAVKLG